VDAGQGAEVLAHLRRAAIAGLTPEERAEAWRQAIALYQGDYMTDLTMEWIEHRRLKLQRQYVLALTHLGEWERDRRRFRDARLLYEKVLAVDPYQDEAHAGLMECLVRLESAAAARAHYLTYARLLREELGAQPPAHLQKLYEQMKREV